MACLLVLRNRLHTLFLGHVGPPFRFFEEVFCNATIDNITGARRPTIQAARSRDTTLKEKLKRSLMNQCTYQNWDALYSVRYDTL